MKYPVHISNIYSEQRFGIHIKNIKSFKMIHQPSIGNHSIAVYVQVVLHQMVQIVLLQIVLKSAQIVLWATNAFSRHLATNARCLLMPNLKASNMHYRQK